jgi:H-type small acid-soluble spore protein
MKIERIQEILMNQPNDIVIKYNGTSIWIESVNELEEIAYIYEKKQPSREYVVSIKHLYEIGQL